MRRPGILAALLIMSLVAAFAAGQPAVAVGISGAFTDDDGSVHEPDINGIAAAGITAGCGGGLYCPWNPITRAEMATFLARAMQLTPLEGGPFTDIGGNIHARNINAIAARGISSGCAAGQYCPNSAVTREQMATFLTRALNLTTSTTPFSDIGGSPHAADIGAIYGAGITAGCGPVVYCPTNLVTRDQMATFLARAFKIDRIYPQVSMVEGVGVGCTKDGLVCSGSISVPPRALYEFREGFYDVAGIGSLSSGATRVELTINGNAISVSPLPIVTSGGLSRRLYRATFGLAPGTHTFVARWFWNGYLEQTTTMSVTLRS